MNTILADTELLFAAIEAENLDAIKQLLAAGVDVLSRVNPDGPHALHFALNLQEERRNGKPKHIETETVRLLRQAAQTRSTVMRIPRREQGPSNQVIQELTQESQ